MTTGLVVTLPYIPLGSHRALNRPGKEADPGSTQTSISRKDGEPVSHRGGAHIVGPTGEGNKQLDRLCPPQAVGSLAMTSELSLFCLLGESSNAFFFL